ncbi:DUF6434 domain-containing protein [Algihabitans sp.]|uniref:DUF6434 domain-containing protein n=1 Tax=Algihabitans sp. TaxID=2821514 RepID=UPI003BAD9FB0
MSARKPSTETRPDLDRIPDAATFRDWYWLKAELVAFCRTQGLSYAGSKAEIAERIARHFESDGCSGPGTASRDPKGESRPRGQRVTSRVNWARLKITPETVITDSYTNGPNVRAFFQTQIGPRFRFNIAFMEWMRANCGKTMADAVQAWLAIECRRKAGEKAPIPASNQYNRYLRDFFEANPTRSLAEARICWLAKRSRRGPVRYSPGDIKVLKG